MRIPTSWSDRDLLEDDPFASEFLIRRLHSEGPSRRSQDWCKQLAQDIRQDCKHRPAAERWIEYAFQPEAHWTRPSRLRGGKEGATAMDLTEVFVRFYWAWYMDESGSAAMKIVNAERRKRGFDYLLPNLLVVTAENSPGMGEGTAPDAVDIGLSPSARIEQVRVLDDATRNSSPPRTPGDRAAVHHRALVESPDLLNGHRSTDPACSASGTNRNAATVDDALDSMGEMIVSGWECDVDSRAYGHLDASTAGTEPSSIVINGVSTPPTAVDPASGSRSRSMTIVALDADPVSLNHSAKRVDRSRRKQRPLDTPPVPRRQLPTRGASNTDRLALLAHEEYRYCVNAKRKRPSDLHIDSAVAASTTSQDQRVHIGKKSKKSQARPTTNDQSTMKAVTSPELQEVASSVHIQRSARDFESSQQTSGIVQRRNAPSKRGKLNGKSSAARKKLRTSDSSARPAKRRRESDDGLNPIGILNSVMAQKMRSGVPAAAPDVPNGNASSPHEILCKRTHSQADIPTYQGDNQPPIRERKIAKEPRKSSNRERLADMPHLVLPPAVLGSPADLPEADRILQNAAAEGLLTLNNEMTLMEEWVDDQEPPEDLPSSDDEEDVPLSAVVASKRRGGLIPQFDSSSSMLSLGSLSRSCQQPRNVAASARSGASPLTVSRVRAGPGRRARPPSPLPKQPLYVQPLIWAESRQEVCESFDWFRSYQGGVYYVNDMVKGYLLSAFSSSRDMFAREGRFIISHGGGKAESMHSTNGQAELFEADDQREDDKSVRALLRTYHMKRPVVLIADDRYALFPYDLAAKGYTYVVLGFYHIAHAWAEREPASNGKGTVVRWKFAFQWCMRQPGPWWLTQERPPNAAAGADLDHGASAFTYFCPSCLKASPFVYEHVGMCLQPDCPTFWTLNGGKPPEDLRYHPTFLNAPFQCDHETMEDISPLPPATGALDGVITSRRFCKGWHCRKCGRLSSRYKWEHWECSNCGAVLQVYGKNRSPKEFWAQINVHNFMHHKCSVDAGIIIPPLQRFRAGSGSGLYHLYILPENRGRIYLILGSPLVNRMADEIFEEYQEQARSGELLFQRWPLKSHHCRGTFLTNYFSHNTGEAYQYVGGTANTVPFDSAPSAVVKARDLIQERMTSVLPADSGEYVFNEVLSAAYMEKQKMAFHSDSERGLGPRVASLSLGSAAFMHFRLHRKYSAEKGSSSNPPALSLFLRHGDVLIMDGAAIQEYYEHTVVPLNFRIAATARYIGAK